MPERMPEGLDLYAFARMQRACAPLAKGKPSGTHTAKALRVI